MPNTSNVTRPLTLIAPGRSGTSLVCNILGAHPDVQFVGETGGFLHSIWEAVRAVEKVSPSPASGSYDDNAAKIARDAMLTLWPSSQVAWIHKPINMSSVSMSWAIEQLGKSKYYTRYWNMFHKTFPKGKFFTILRDPRDVVASQMERWKKSAKMTWEIYASIMEILAWDNSLVNTAWMFDAFFEDREKQVRSLLKFAKLPFHQACLDAAVKVYVPGKRKDLSSIKKHRDWSIIGKPNFLQKRNINDAWAKFGAEIDW